VVGAGVERRERAAHQLVRHPCDPSELAGGRLDEPAKPLDEHQLREPCEHRLAARTGPGQLLPGELDEAGQGLALLGSAGDEHSPGEGGEERVERPHLAAEEPADHLAPLSAARAEVHRERQRHPRRGIHPDLDRWAGEPGLAGHDVPVVLRQEDDVTGVELDRRLPLHADPARTRGDGVERDHAVDARVEERLHRSGGRAVERPGRDRVDGEEHRARQADRAKHVGEDVGGRTLARRARQGLGLARHPGLLTRNGVPGARPCLAGRAVVDSGSPVMGRTSTAASPEHGS
jgi:hypothetical protein